MKGRGVGQGLDIAETTKIGSKQNPPTNTHRLTVDFKNPPEKASTVEAHKDPRENPTSSSH